MEDGKPRRRRNLKRDKPTLYKRWLNNCRMAELHFQEEPDELYFAKVDEVAAGLVNGNPYSPVRETRRKGNITFDAAIAKRGELPSRSIFEAEHHQSDWNYADEEVDEDAVETGLDAQQVLERKFQAARYLPTRQRCVEYDDLIDEAHDCCGADYAERKYDELRDHDPAYVKHNDQQREGHSRQGRPDPDRAA